MNADTTEDPKRFFEFRIEVRDAPVPLWRNVLAPAHLPLTKVSEVMASMFGQEDSIEGYTFRRGDQAIAYTSAANPSGVTEVRGVSLEDVLHTPGDTLAYEDDWASTWYLDVELVSVRDLPDLPSHRLVLLSGEGASPPESIWDMESYHECIEARGDPTHPDHAWTLREGKDFDPRSFDAEAVRARLAEIPLPGRRPAFLPDDVLVPLERSAPGLGVDELRWDHAGMCAIDMALDRPNDVCRIDRPETLAAAALWATNGWQDPWSGRPPQTLALEDLAAFYDVDPERIVTVAELMAE